MKSVLVVHPRLTAQGGGQAVGAWALQALRDRFRVTLLTLIRPDLPAINRQFGTDLCEGDFELQVVHAAAGRWVDSFPTPLHLMDIALISRAAQRCSAGYDALLSTHNEIDFGRYGVQYIHFPWRYDDRPEEDYRWYHRLPGAVPAYRGIVKKLSRASQERIRRNRTLANSQFIRGLVSKAHGVDAVVLPPPVAGGFPPLSWSEKENVVVGVGRLAPYKRWREAIEIVRGVRANGLDLRLRIIGPPDDPDYAAELSRRAREEPWIEVLVDMPRSELVEQVARCRYGIHLMVEEHFGIAPAELQRAGCLTFVHASGGPLEIVEADDDVLFRSDEEATAMISRMMRDESLQAAAVQRLERRAERYSEEAFMERIRQEMLAASRSGGATAA